MAASQLPISSPCHTTAALAAEVFHDPEDALADACAEVVDLGDVAARRERMAAYAKATRPVIAYHFVFPPGASVIGAGGERRAAAAQLEWVVGLTGGALTRSHGGLAARIPRTLAVRFEAMAAPLICRLAGGARSWPGRPLGRRVAERCEK